MHNKFKQFPSKVVNANFHSRGFLQTSYLSATSTSSTHLISGKRKRKRMKRIFGCNWQRKGEEEYLLFFPSLSSDPFLWFRLYWSVFERIIVVFLSIQLLGGSDTCFLRRVVWESKTGFENAFAWNSHH
jgi:hypothetical protein